MRTLPVSLAALSLVLAACADGIPSAPGAGSALVVREATSGSARADAPAARPRREIRGECTTTFNPPPFPLPATHEQSDEGTCTFTHLGATELAGVQTINFAAGTQTGSRTFTAANGDHFYTTHVGTSAPGAAPGTVDFRAVLTITGGTGRFAGATGELRAAGTATLALRSTRVRFEGWIEY